MIRVQRVAEWLGLIPIKSAKNTVEGRVPTAMVGDSAARIRHALAMDNDLSTGRPLMSDTTIVRQVQQRLMAIDKAKAAERFASQGRGGSL